MANIYKDEDRLPLVGQNPNAGNLVIKQPSIDRNVAELHNTGVTPAAPEGFEGSSKAVYTHNDSQGAVKDSMNKNSGLWWEAKAAGDTDWMKSLEDANKQLAGLLGDGVTFDSTTGTWSGVADMPTTMQASMTTGVNPQLPTFDYDAWLKENPAPTYQSAYNARIDQLMNDLLAREKFSYDAESDPLFQQYKNIYTREGNRSMNDTLAAAASGAGGMSSYAMTAAQQANNYYMAQLGDKIPELQQLAYDMYLNDVNLQRQDIGMLMDKDAVDYGKYRDTVSDWNNDRNFGYGMYRDQMGDYQWGTEFNYGASRDAVNDAWRETEWNYGLERDKIEDEWRQKQWDYGLSRDEIEDMWREKEWNYGVGRDQIEDGRYNSSDAYNRAMEMLTLGAMPSSDLLAQAGISQEQADAILSGMYIDGDYGGSEDDNGWTGDNNPPLDDKEATANFWNSASDLGIGPVNANFLLEIAEYGGIVENADGTLSWANGWNASNYKEKLNQAKNMGQFFMNFLP